MRIDRGNEGQDYAEIEDEVAFTCEFGALKEPADAVEEVFEAEGREV